MTVSAPDTLTSLIAAFDKEFGKQPNPSPYLDSFITALEDCAGNAGAVPARKTAQLPAYDRYMPNLRAGMIDNDVSRTITPLIDQLDWYQIFDGDGIEPEFATGLLAGQIIGKRGIISAENVFVGLFLLAPGICYPLHQHPAQEVYYVLSGQIDIRHGRAKAPMHIAAGDLSVTPPHQVHELKTGDAPCLIAYIWTGDMKGENWWWEEQPDGSWDRICWERQTDSSWAIAKREPLSEVEISRAGDR